MRSRRNRFNRREFLEATAAASLGFWLSGTQAWADVEQPDRKPVSAHEKLNVAFVAVAGRAAENIAGIKPLANANIVALCDVDERRMGDAIGEFPQAKVYHDYHKMIDEMKEMD